jgi:hypothetical protein
MNGLKQFEYPSTAQVIRKNQALISKYRDTITPGSNRSIKLLKMQKNKMKEDCEEVVMRELKKFPKVSSLKPRVEQMPMMLRK